MATWYLDSDDEITDAVARLRTTSDEHVVFVVPPGSRIATGRINFKLLAREAEGRELQLAVASPDEQVRALATSAGVMAAATPDDAEAALERGDAPPVPSQEPEPPETAPVAAASAAPPVASRFSRGRLAVVTVAVLGVVVVGGYAGAPSISTADVSVTPRTSQLGPLAIPILAAADVAEPDTEAGRIPAVELSIPLRAAAVFEATGAETVEERAGGEVVFSSPDQEFDQEIVAGTRLQTPAGVAFQTIETVTLPRSVAGGAAEVAAAVEALEPGAAGNVPSGAISVVPSLENQGISVRNPEATQGGSIEQTPLVTAADYDAAAVDLQNRLAGALAAHLRDPASVPEGLRLFAETARQGPVTLDPPPDAVVGTSQAGFELAAEALATVLAVDPQMASELVSARLEAAIEDGVRVFPDSVRIEVDGGSVHEDGIRFAGTASAVVYELVDSEALGARIAGVPIPEARAILEEIGETTVNVWPEFVNDLPDDDDRITIVIREPSSTE